MPVRVFNTDYINRVIPARFSSWFDFLRTFFVVFEKSVGRARAENTFRRVRYVTTETMEEGEIFETKYERDFVLTGVFLELHDTLPSKTELSSAILEYQRTGKGEKLEQIALKLTNIV
jgi:hypothetical protein